MSVNAYVQDVVRILTRPPSRSEGMVLAARGELDAAIEAMDRALVAHLRRQRPLEHGRTLLEATQDEPPGQARAAS
jgi:hypothetical protein